MGDSKHSRSCSSSALPPSGSTRLKCPGREMTEKKVADVSGYTGNASSSRRESAKARSESLGPSDGSSRRVPSRSRPSALGMAYSRGAQRMRDMRAKQAQGFASDLDKSLFVLELAVRNACTAFQNAWREVCAVRACSCQLRDICSEDHVWEQLFKLRWPQQTSFQTVPDNSWRKAFLSRLQRVQASFLARNMPSLVQKTRRRDGFPDLRKLCEALRMSFSLSIAQSKGSKSSEFFFKSDASIQLFESALCLRCTFSSQLWCPLHFNLRGRSSAVGKEELLVTSSLQKLEDWNASSEGDCNFFRSPCGRLFAAFWGDGTLAGMYITLHYAQILGPILGESEAWSLLAGRPQPDDLDSSLGLHDYTVMLSLRSAKLECFSNTFYKVHLFGLGSTNKSGFGGAGVLACQCS